MMLGNELQMFTTTGGKEELS